MKPGKIQSYMASFENNTTCTFIVATSYYQLEKIFRLFYCRGGGGECNFCDDGFCDNAPN